MMEAMLIMVMVDDAYLYPKLRIIRLPNVKTSQNINLF